MNNMAANKSYYDILGVDKNASPDEIKSSFRKMAKNTILISTNNQEQKLNSKKQVKFTPFQVIQKKRNNMT